MTVKPHKVFFFEVQSNQQKLAKLFETANEHFQRKEPLLILVDSEKAQKFIDDLLWQHPPKSFLPHEILTEKSSSLIGITASETNHNSARYVFNLRSNPLANKDFEFRVLYEFEDRSSKEKALISKKKYHDYKELGFAITSL